MNTSRLSAKSVGMIYESHTICPRETFFDPVSVCDMLLKWKKRTAFKIGDEKIIVAVWWLHPKKILLKVWRDCEGVLPCELLPNNWMIRTAHSWTFCRQQSRESTLWQRKGLALRSSRTVKDLMFLWGQDRSCCVWVGCPTSPSIFSGHYSLRLPPFSDLFRIPLMQQGSIFFTWSKITETSFFHAGTVKFWEDKIFSLQGRWKKVVQTGYIYLWLKVGPHTWHSFKCCFSARTFKGNPICGSMSRGAPSEGSHSIGWYTHVMHCTYNPQGV